MSQVKHIQNQIEALPHEDFVRLREWFAEKDWQQWDEQLANDVEAGRLEGLLQEAAAAKAKGTLTDL